MQPRLTIELVPPTTTCEESFLRGLREFRSEGLPWWTGGDTDLAEHDFPAFVAKRLAEPHKTHLWALAGDRFVGRIAIRHELTDALRVEGGHIGYDTVPSFRGRGIATEMLRQALPVARRLGLSSVLLTCDETNVASTRVIERNGGALEARKDLGANRPPKCYYWITLP